MYRNTFNLERKLKEYSDSNSEYYELWSTWDLNKKTLEPILNAIIKDYPYYSMHDHTHSESILINISRFLGNANIDNLSPTDIWLLLHVAYLHDFGMVVLDSKINEFWDNEGFADFLEAQSLSDDKDIKEAATLILSYDENNKFEKTWPLKVKSAVTLLISIYCRWQHAAFSKEYILDIENIWGIDLGHNGLIKKRFISLIAHISDIHTKPFEEIFTLPIEENGFNNDYAHPRLIACLLRIGDVLDLDNGRFNPYGEKIFGNMPESSKIHYVKHESTKHVLVTSDIIEVEADCPDDDVFRETRRWYDYLKSEIDNLHLNWAEIATKEFLNPPRLKPYKILRNGVEDNSGLTNLRFQISQRKAFELMEGSSIYKNSFACIRELIQNAEDASKIQLWRDLQSGVYLKSKFKGKKLVDILPNDIDEEIYNNYSIDITVGRNESNNAVVTITDHGTGISINTIKSICNVGESYFQDYERKKEIESMPVWLRPTASFGVGLQSCFMVTDKITIYTKTNNDSYKITFKSGQNAGYVNVESSKDIMKRGSKAVIEIKNELVPTFKYEMFGFTAKNMAKFDPFKTNCVLEYRVIEEIFKDCRTTFFDINIQTDDEVGIHETIEKYYLNGEEFPYEVFKDTYYSFDRETLKILFWYKNNFYSITPNSSGNMDVSYKGKKLSKSNIGVFLGYDIVVDIYGKATKESLTLNREELKYSTAYEISEDLHYLFPCYFEILFNKKSKELQANDKTDLIMLTSWKYDKPFPKELFNCLSIEKKYNILKCENGEYTKIQCSAYDLCSKYMYPDMFFVNEKLFRNPIYANSEITMESLIADLNITTNEYNEILADNNVQELIYDAIYDITFIAEKDSCCLSKRSHKKELYSPDEFTKKCLIKNLVYKDSSIMFNRPYMQRLAINAFKEFEKLAVKIDGLKYLGCNKNCYWYIISPITMDDSSKCRTMSKDEFIYYITNQPEFYSLIDYVTNDKNSMVKSSKDEIISEYKRLIGSYYDVVNEETSKDLCCE